MRIFVGGDLVWEGVIDKVSDVLVLLLNVFS